MAVRPGKTKDARFFITDASSSVARILICDQGDPVSEPGGRLLKVVPVPVDSQECWINAHFTVDSSDIMEVRASGLIARASLAVRVPNLSFGYKLR